MSKFRVGGNSNFNTKSQAISETTRLPAHKTPSFDSSSLGPRNDTIRGAASVAPRGPGPSIALGKLATLCQKPGQTTPKSSGNNVGNASACLPTLSNWLPFKFRRPTTESLKASAEKSFMATSSSVVNSEAMRESSPSISTTANNLPPNCQDNEMSRLLAARDSKKYFTLERMAAVRKIQELENSHIERLGQFSPSSHTATPIQAKLSESKPFHQRMQDLIGKTIDPTVASQIMSHSNVAVFDGFGRLTSFAQPIFPERLLSQLEAAIIKPLTTTNARITERNAPRAEREILTRSIYLLGMSKDPTSVMLRDQAKQLFLSGSLNRGSVSDFISRCQVLLGQAGDVLMEDQFKKLFAEISKPIETTQLTDNIYGRAFESILVNDLVNDPPDDVLNAAAALGQGVLDTLGQYNQHTQQDLLKKMAQMLGNDQRPGFDKLQSLQQFTKNPSMETLKECMAETGSGVEAIKIPFIATCMAIAMKGLEPSQQPRWRKEANGFYATVIRPQKPSAGAVLQDVNIESPGTFLHYHPKYKTTGAMSGINWTHNKLVTPGKLSTFEHGTLSSGQTVINGPSGTTNLMTFFGQHLAANNPDFPKRAHHLNTLMFVVFDGGHSTQEVLATMEAIKRRKSGDATASLGNYAGGYKAISRLSDTSGGRHDLKDRLDKATELTMRYFTDNML